jgi:hypothetical protein
VSLSLCIVVSWVHETFIIQVLSEFPVHSQRCEHVSVSRLVLGADGKGIVFLVYWLLCFCEIRVNLAWAVKCRSFTRSEYVVESGGLVGFVGL